MTKIFSIITYVLLLYIDGITRTADITENPLFFFQAYKETMDSSTLPSCHFCFVYVFVLGLSKLVVGSISMMKSATSYYD